MERDMTEEQITGDEPMLGGDKKQLKPGDLVLEGMDIADIWFGRTFDVGHIITVDGDKYTVVSVEQNRLTLEYAGLPYSTDYT
jgi:hypothetical protein